MTAIAKGEDYRCQGGESKMKVGQPVPAAPILLPMHMRVELMHVCEFYLNGA